MLFASPVWQAELAKHVRAKQTQGPGRQEMPERYVGQVDCKVDTKFTNKYWQTLQWQE